MKKLILSTFLLALPLLASAQEIWSAASVIDRSGSTPIVVGAVKSTFTEGIYATGTSEGPNIYAPGSLDAEIITGQTENITLSIVSTPNRLSKKDIADGKTQEFWSVKGGEGSNDALTTDECTPRFESCIMPKGQPTTIYWDYYEVYSYGDDVFRIGGTEDIYWTEGKPLPVKGSYIKIEANASFFIV